MCITIVIDPLRITIVIDILHITIVIVLLHITIVIDLLHITFVIDLLRITIVIDLLRIAIVNVLLHILLSKFVYSCYSLIFIYTQTKYVFCRSSVGFCGAKNYHISFAIDMKLVKYVARPILVHSECYIAVLNCRGFDPPPDHTKDIIKMVPDASVLSFRQVRLSMAEMDSICYEQSNVNDTICYNKTHVCA